ncbi:MAG: hypothetical protein DBY23_04805 [Bacillota bacterium]|nr:MAG: hypothetical protein DBY23_04805 [Bacillota bacterium]
MDISRIYSKVFGWMFIGLLVTFGTGFLLANSPELLIAIYSNTWLYIALIIAELAFVIVFSARVTRMSKAGAITCFLGYSILTGLTFASVFLVYSLESIFLCFGAAAALFGIMAVFGYVTKIDLSRFGTVLFMILLGSVIVSLINLFIGNTTVDLFLSIIILAVFICYVAYDMKKITAMVEFAGEDNGSIYMALQLYLDFINIFLRLLQLFGGRDD